MVTIRESRIETTPETTFGEVIKHVIEELMNSGGNVMVLETQVLTTRGAFTLRAEYRLAPPDEAPAAPRVH